MRPVAPTFQACPKSYMDHRATNIAYILQYDAQPIQRAFYYKYIDLSKAFSN